jgi:hypothetical protein
MADLAEDKRRRPARRYGPDAVRAQAAAGRARAAREAECTEAAEIDGLAVRAIRLIGPSRPGLRLWAAGGTSASDH